MIKLYYHSKTLLYVATRSRHHGEEKMFPYLRLSRLKVVIARPIQLEIMQEIEKNFQKLILKTPQDEQAFKAFKMQAKKILEQIKFSLDRHTFDEDIIDAILEIGDYIVHYVSGFTQRKPVDIMRDMMPKPLTHSHVTYSINTR